MKAKKRIYVTRAEFSLLLNESQLVTADCYGFETKTRYVKPKDIRERLWCWFHRRKGIPFTYSVQRVVENGEVGTILGKKVILK